MTTKLRDARSGASSAKVAPAEIDAGIVDVAPRRLYRPAVDIDQGQVLDLGGPQDRPRQITDPASEIGSPSRQRRKMLFQQGAARIDTVPAEDARLRPEPEILEEPRRAFEQRGLSMPPRRIRTRHDADPVMAPRGVGHLAAEARQFLGQSRATLVLGRQHGQAPAR